MTSAKKETSQQSFIKILFLTAITMVAFAANSVFGRLSLSLDAIDPASFTAVRLISGALMLFLLVSLRGGLFTKGRQEGGFLKPMFSGLALFGYAAFFSFAYISVDTGIGALILFACVQFIMIGYGLYSGERPSLQAWIGIVLAFGGFIYLVSPGLSAPDFKGSVLMALSGVSWAVYSLMGRGVKKPVQASARNFILTVPLSLILIFIFLNEQHLTSPGVMLAITSGAGTSALGYVLWYNVLKSITATNAAIVQLTVPVIATLGGILLLDELLTLRIIIASVLILGGVALSILAAKKI